MERRMSSRVKSGTKTLGVGKKVPKETIKKVFCKSKKTSCDVVCNKAKSEEMMEVTQSAEVSDQKANMEDLPGASSPCEMPMEKAVDSSSPQSVSEVRRCGASTLLECSLSNAEVGDSEVSEAQAEGGSSGASAEEKDKMASASSSSEASGETLRTAAPAHCYTNNTETNTVEEVTSREASVKDSPAKHMAGLEALCGQLAVAVAEGALDGTEETRTGARVLDLCYNNLTPDDVTRLGVLSHLRVLHLSGNGLTHLPPDMSVSHIEDLALPLFPALEILMLDENNLSHPAVFLSVANLIRLRLLNLDNNSISGIPYLYPADTTPRTNPPNKECEEKGAEDGLKTFHYTVIPSKDDPDRTEVIFTDQENSQKDDHVMKASDATESFRFHSHMSEDGSSQALVPLPSLRYLSLANNKIRHQEKLLAAALFPSLEELVIHGNPLTTLRKGDPPLLSDVLQQRLGIHITTKKPPEIRKLPLFIPVNEGRKVQSVIPKVPKQPLIVEPPFSPKLPFDRRHPLSDGKEFTPLPPITPSSERRSQDSEQSSEMTVEVETSSGSGDAAESIFMTQVDDLPESAHVSQSGSPSQPEAEEEEEEEEEIPKKFKGYEELFHVQTDPEFIDPVGIQSNVRALQNALSHLLVYRDSKPRLSGLHKPYIPTESKVGKLLTPLPRKDKKEILGEILAGMRESRNLSQVPLNSILGQKKPTLEKREAQTLLRELQFRYKALQAESATRAQEMERCSGRAGATVDNKWNAGNVTDPSTQN